MKPNANKKSSGLTTGKRYKNDILYLSSKVIQIRAYIFLVLVLTASSGYSQTANDSVITHQNSGPSVLCFGIGIGGGNHISIGASLDILGELDNSQSTRIGLSLCYKGSTFSPANKPDDYEFGILDYGGLESSTMISAMLSIETPTDQKNPGFGFALGPAFNYINEITYSRNSGTHWLVGNYDKEYNRSSTTGLLMNMKLKFPLLEKFGLEVASYLNINSHKTLVGIQVNLIFGRI